MATRRFRWLLICFILLYTVTFCPFLFLLLLLLLLYLFFTPFSIGGRRITLSMRKVVPTLTSKKC
jgi:hypothetical protein